jgi:hypothetical protein
MFGINVPDDYGNTLDDALDNAANQQGYLLNNANNTTALGDIYSDPNTNPYGSQGTTNVFGSTNATAAADNSGNTAALTAADTAGFPQTGIASLSKWLADNKGLLSLAGAGAALMNNNSGIQKTGYQGSIPNLIAGRNMISAPPTRAQGYRPGAGGINYGGDVSYVRTPGVDPWAYLSGTSGTAAGANLNDNAGLYTAYLNSLNNTGGSSADTQTGGSAASTVTGGFGATNLAGSTGSTATTGSTAAATAAATKAANDAATKAAADASAKAASDLAAAQKANDATAIAAAQKAAADAAAATKAAADKIAADKAAADKIAADKVAADKIAADNAAAAKAAADKIAADAATAKAASDKAAADAAAIAASNATAAQKAAAAKAAADAKAASDKAAADAKAAADKIAADKAAADKAAEDKTIATNTSFMNAAAALKKANTPVASANDINSWILNNTNASAADIAAAAKAGNVSNTDIQNALNLSTFSPAVKSIITSGQGLDTLNANINKWVTDHPFATAAEIAEIQKTSGVSNQDVANALTDKTASAAKEYALTQGMGLNQFYQNILDFQAKSPTEKQAADAMKASGVSQADVDMAGKYAVSQLPNVNDSISKYLADQKLMADIPDINKSISTYLDSQKPPPPDINKSISSYLADQKLLSEVPDINKSISTYLASQQPPPPDINKSISTYLADQKLLADVPDINNSISTYLANQKAAEVAAPKANNNIYEYFANPETQAALASGNTRSIAETMQSLGWSPAAVAAATGTNEADIQAAYNAALGSANKQESVNQYRPAGEEDYSYMQFAEGGMAKGRYLQGGTDGMADEIPAQIGQDQPAALSHGEFVVPADVVSHLGNGNSDAGAKKLYQMMDKIRMARTGNKKQGKRINPDNFMPGGLAQAYAAGGHVKKFAGETGSLVNAGIAGMESNLSNWVGPYVTNMLGQGQALANMPYQPYMGQLTAGTSPLQNQAFTNASNLSMPSSVTAGINTATDVANTVKNLPAYGATTFSSQFKAPDAYSPTTATNQFSAPTPYSETNFTNQYVAPTDIPEATNFTNQYTSPTAYNPTTSAFDQAQLQSYMNPYLMNSLNPQINEARRQSEITQQQNAAKMTQAGGYGGGRQAILDAETQRNLGTNLANIVGQGYNTAYGNAQQQFNADQNRKMQEAQFGAQQGMNAAQLQAQYGLSAQQANEMARQFESQQKMNAAQQTAQFGQSANQATEASKQFGAQMGMTSAQQAAQYGQAAQQQNELARQFASQQGLASAQSAAQYAQAANQATEASKQFGANYGLQGLQTGLQAAQAQGTLGGLQSQIGINNLNAQLNAGATQRAIEAEGIAADKAAFEEARANPFKMVQYQQSLLQGLPTSAQSYQGIEPSALTKAAQGATTVNQLLKNLGLA